MKTLHSGTSEFPYDKTVSVKYDWKFEDAEDHEHPYILTVKVAGHTHSEGCERILEKAEAATKAEKLAQEVYATTQARS